MSDEKLSVIFLSGTDTFVIKKTSETKMFITTPDSFIIGKDGFIFLIDFMVKNKFISPKTLEGILEEINTE
jgi:hypothetical protein